MLLKCYPFIAWLDLSVGKLILREESKNWGVPCCFYLTSTFGVYKVCTALCQLVCIYIYICIYTFQIYVLALFMFPTFAEENRWVPVSNICLERVKPYHCFQNKWNEVHNRFFTVEKLFNNIITIGEIFRAGLVVYTWLLYWITGGKDLSSSRRLATLFFAALTFIHIPKSLPLY